MPKRLKRCVRKVKAQNRKRPKGKRANPYAVCSASTGQKPHKKGKR